MSQPQFQSCIDACNECAAACEHCAAACLQEPDVQMMARCIALDIDCAQVCRVAASMMQRGSTQAGELCRVCAEICDACGEECARHAHQHCQQCADACRRCAAECRNMSGMVQSQVRPAGAAARH